MSRDFRAEVRDWLQARCPPEMRQPMSDADRCWGGSKWVFSSPAQREWLQRMAQQGWTAPDWPREYGGAALSAAEVKVLHEEMQALGCRPPLDRVSQALGLLGPTILQIGTEAQKRQHLRAIADGSVRWCQGYSEPGAGSDLASVQTRAEDRGDHFLVNGQKIWTSAADQADWIFMLVRTDPSAPKHRGISFLLVDMQSPGIDVQPIRLISGKSPFCQTFFDNVVVPKENLLGELHAGWDVSRLLLAHERSSIATARSLTASPSLGDRVRRLQGAEGRLSDELLRADLARWEMDAWCFTALAELSGDLAAAGQPLPASFPSVLKNHYSELNQRRYELLMSAGGIAHLDWDEDHPEPFEDARMWLRSKANTIEGGSTEIQLNIIARRILELPG